MAQINLYLFDKIRKEVGLPVLTDVHTAEQCSIVANHVDVLQIPAFSLPSNRFISVLPKLEK